MRILLAEKDERVARVVRWLLEDDDREAVVDTVHDGDAAVEHAGGHDAVVLAVALPGCDGLTALKRIRRSHPDLPVIVFSAYDQPYLQAEAFRRGAFAFLAKATEGHLLSEVVRSSVHANGL